MRPTKRVARLRATNNSCLYSSPSLVLFLCPPPPPSSFLSRGPLRSPSWSSLPLLPRCSPFAPPLVRRSNSNSCLENLPRPSASTFKVVGSGPKSDRHRRPDNKRPLYLPLPPRRPARSVPIILLRNYRSYFSIHGDRRTVREV